MLVIRQHNIVATNKKTASSVTHTANSIGASYKVSDALTVQAYSGTTEKQACADGSHILFGKTELQ